jgi:hypothetical protein
MCSRAKVVGIFLQVMPPLVHCTHDSVRCQGRVCIMGTRSVADPWSTECAAQCQRRLIRRIDRPLIAIPHAALGAKEAMEQHAGCLADIDRHRRCTAFWSVYWSLLTLLKLLQAVPFGSDSVCPECLDSLQRRHKCDSQSGLAPAGSPQQPFFLKCRSNKLDTQRHAMLTEAAGQSQGGHTSVSPG